MRLLAETHARAHSAGYLSEEVLHAGRAPCCLHHVPCHSATTHSREEVKNGASPAGLSRQNEQQLKHLLAVGTASSLSPPRLGAAQVVTPAQRSSGTFSFQQLSGVLRPPSSCELTCHKERGHAGARPKAAAPAPISKPAADGRCHTSNRSLSSRMRVSATSM